MRHKLTHIYTHVMALSPPPPTLSHTLEKKNSAIHPIRRHSGLTALDWS